MHTERLIADLDDMAVKIATVQGVLRSGHSLTDTEVLEWIAAVRRHRVVYHSMMIVLLPKVHQ